MTVGAEVRRKVLEEFVDLMRAIHFGGVGRAVPWAEVGLTLPQLKLLGLLASRPEGMHGRELARVLGIRPSAVTALVERVVEPGYAWREEDPRDRRIIRVRITERGRELLERMAAGQRELLGRMLDQLSPDELVIVQQALRRLRTACERLAAERAQPSAC